MAKPPVNGFKKGHKKIEGSGRKAGKRNLVTQDMKTALLDAATAVGFIHEDNILEVLVNYLGFPFWDVLTFSVTTGRGTGELREILVDRISPEEVHTLKGFEGIKSLKGIGFGNFAGLFSRRYRENDYLLGRLHALDRLMDIVCDAAGIDVQSDGIDLLALKRRAFERILNAEEPHLIHSKELIAAIRRRVADIGSP